MTRRQHDRAIAKHNRQHKQRERFEFDEYFGIASVLIVVIGITMELLG